MNRILLFFAILTMACMTSCETSTYSEQEAENQQKRELIIGKWVCRRPGTKSDYAFYVFRVDGTGIEGLCDNPLVTQNPTVSAGGFRYAVFNGEIAICPDYWNHDHPMTPGTICDSNMPLSFTGFTVDETTLQFNRDRSYPFTRVSQWSDVGLPDDLLPE